MRNVIVILAAFAVLVQASYRTLTVAAFLLNREYIELNLCENRMKANSDCHGKCVLQKKIETQKNEHHKALAIAFESQNETVYFYNITLLNIQKPNNFKPEKALIPTGIRRFNSTIFLSDIFKPPIGMA